MLWRAANLPDQEIDALSRREVALNLKALYLLSDQVVAAASVYFESDATRSAATSLRSLFERGDVMFFIDDAVATFEEHGRLKMEKSPLEMPHYRDLAVVRERSLELASLGHTLRRPAVSISDLIAAMWIDDLKSGARGTLGETLHLLWRGDERIALGARLEALARGRERDFVWDYVSPRLVELAVPDRMMRLARRRLTEFYSSATVAALGLVERAECSDSACFVECMTALGLRTHLARMGTTELVLLKRSPEWLLFRAFYFSMYRSLGRVHAPLALPFYREAESLLSSRAASPPTDLLRAFESFRGLVSASVNLDAAPFEVLVRSYAILGSMPIERFVDRVARRLRASGHDATLAPILSGGGQMSMNVLFLASSPDDAVRLQVAREARELDDRLRRSELRDFVRVEYHLATRPDDLQEALMRYNPSVVHFSGHGTATGAIVLESESGTGALVDTPALVGLFRVLGGSCRCVLLNACFSDAQARALVEHVGCVVGMADTISDDAARAFTSGFYEALGYGRSIRDAFDLAVNRIRLRSIAEHDVPRLVVRMGGEAVLEEVLVRGNR